MNKVKLCDIFDLQMGKTPARNNSSLWNGKNKWISIADLGNSQKFISKTKETISDEGVKNSGIKVVPKNTVIMSFKLSIGKTAITTENMYTNEAIMAFIDKKKYPININYIYHLFSNFNWALNTNKAVMGLVLNKAKLSQIKVPIPSIKEQNYIANVLDKVDKLIILQRNQLKKLDLLVKSRFIELFGDPYINTFGWNKQKLSHHLDVIGGYAFKSKEFKKVGIPVLRIGNINSGRFLPVNMVYWDNDINLEKYKIYSGDLVISLTGTVGKNDYGNVCIVGNDYPIYYLNQRNAKLILKDSLNKYYLSELLKFPKIKQQLTGISRGIRQANIANRDILNLQVPIPPIEIQQKYSRVLVQINKSKVEIQKSLDKLEILKKSLMQQYFG